MRISSILCAGAVVMMMASCGATKEKGSDSAASVTETAVMEPQPVESGLYNAATYDITGDEARKGRFDGRIYFTLSPEQSAFYVYENGNRTKIDYKVVLERPFEKGDSGIYSTTDVKGLDVRLRTDSVYVLEFTKNDDQVKIGFDPAPKFTGTPLEILEKMNEQIQKNKK